MSPQKRNPLVASQLSGPARFADLRPGAARRLFECRFVPGQQEWPIAAAAAHAGAGMGGDAGGMSGRGLA